MQESLIGLDDPAGWSVALDGIPHGFAHTWDACNAMHHTTRYPTYLYCWQKGSRRVVCPFAERQFKGTTDIVTPFGFSAFAGNEPAPEFFADWHAFVKRRGYVCGYFALHPTLGSDSLHGAGEYANTLYIMDLSLGENDLLRRASQKRRRAIKKWHESNRVFVEDRERLTEFLIQNYNEFMRGVGASAGTFRSDQTLELFCSSPRVDLVGVEEAGHVVAIHAFARTKWDSESLFFLALPEGREYMTALYWEAVTRGIASGIPTLNLGGGVRPDDSIASAKKLYGAQPRDFRCLKEIYTDAEYIRLSRAAGVNSADQTGYFPQYRRATKQNS